MSFITRASVAASVVSFLRAKEFNNAVNLIKEHGWLNDDQFARELTEAMLDAHLPAAFFMMLHTFGGQYASSMITNYVATWMREYSDEDTGRMSSETIAGLINMLPRDAKTEPLGQNLRVVANFTDTPRLPEDVTRAIHYRTNGEYHWDEPLVMLRDITNFVLQPDMDVRLHCGGRRVYGRLWDMLCDHPHAINRLNLRFVIKYLVQCGQLDHVKLPQVGTWDTRRIDEDEIWFPVADKIMAALGCQPDATVVAKRKADTPSPSPPPQRLTTYAYRSFVMKIRDRKLDEALDSIEAFDLKNDEDFCEQLVLEMLSAHYFADSYRAVIKRGYKLDLQTVTEYLGDWLWFRTETSAHCGDWCKEATYVDLLQLINATAMLSVYGCNLLVLAIRRAQTTPEIVRCAVEFACQWQFKWADELLMLEDMSELPNEEINDRVFCGDTPIGSQLPSLLVKNAATVLTTGNLRYVVAECVDRGYSLDWFRDWCALVTPAARSDWKHAELKKQTPEWIAQMQPVVEAVRGKK